MYNQCHAAQQSMTMEYQLLISPRGQKINLWLLREPCERSRRSIAAVKRSQPRENWGDGEGAGKDHLRTNY